MGPIASPRYHPKNDNYIDTAPRYTNAAHCHGVAVMGWVATDTMVMTIMTGDQMTSVHEIVCHDPSSRETTAPSL